MERGKGGSAEESGSVEAELAGTPFCRSRRCRRCRRRRRRFVREKSILSAPRGDVGDVARRKTETTVGTVLPSRETAGCQAGEHGREERRRRSVSDRSASGRGIKNRRQDKTQIARDRTNRSQVGSDCREAGRLMRFSAAAKHGAAARCSAHGGGIMLRRVYVIAAIDDSS